MSNFKHVSPQTYVAHVFGFGLLVFLLACTAGCGTETLNVGEPSEDSNGTTSNGTTASNGTTSNGTTANTSNGTSSTSNGTTVNTSNGTTALVKRELSPVDDFREPGYIVRSRPKGLELSADGAMLFVTLAGNLIDPGRELLALNPANGQELARITVGTSPQGMTLSPDGTKLYVANQFSNYLTVVNTSTLTVAGEIPVSFYAQDIAVSADGGTLYVTNRWLDALEVVRLSNGGVDGEVVAEVAVGTNPRDVVVGSSGMVYVGSLAATSISVVDPSLMVEVNRVHTNSPVNGLAVGHGFVFAATLGVGDGHTKLPGMGDDGIPFRGDSTASIGFADINNDVVVLTDDRGALLYRYTSDTAEVSHADVENDYAPGQMIVVGALPEQAVVQGNNLFVSMSSSDQVQCFSIDTSTGVLTPAAVFDTGTNPFEIAVSPDGRTLFTADRLGETVSRIDIATQTRNVFAVGQSPQPYPANDYEVGEMLFHSAKFSSEALPSSVFPAGDKAGDKSCNHCHRETLTDGKVWTVGPGLIVPLGGERMPPAARNIRDTLPLFWEGVQTEEDFDLESGEFSPLEDFEGANEEAQYEARDQFFLAQVGLDFEQVGREKLGLFLIGRPRLLPNPNAQFPEAEVSEAIARGQALFNSAEVQCSVCHPNGGSNQPFTTNNTIDPVISWSPLDNGFLVQPFEIDGTFNIPSIRGVWDRPRVYFHDGRAKSIRSAILGPGHSALVAGDDGCHLLADETDKFIGGVFRSVYNGRGCNELNGATDTHGGTSNLSSTEVDDLLQYVLSIE